MVTVDAAFTVDLCCRQRNRRSDEPMFSQLTLSVIARLPTKDCSVFAPSNPFVFVRSSGFMSFPGVVGIVLDGVCFFVVVDVVVGTSVVVVCSVVVCGVLPVVVVVVVVGSSVDVCGSIVVVVASVSVVDDECAVTGVVGGVVGVVRGVGAMRRGVM